MTDNFNLACQISERTSDSYMADSYGEERWIDQIQDLLDAGYDEQEVEWIVRSKIARWADDMDESMLDYINRRVGGARLRTWMRKDL